jgi:uncharacterized protein YjbI with pentapeptide repeats
MRLFFRRPLAAASNETLPPPNEERRGEPTPAKLTFRPEAELVRSESLPSATAALAELFPEDATLTTVAHATPTAASRAVETHNSVAVAEPPEAPGVAAQIAPQEPLVKQTAPPLPPRSTYGRNFSDIDLLREAFRSSEPAAKIETEAPAIKPAPQATRIDTPVPKPEPAQPKPGPPVSRPGPPILRPAQAPASAPRPAAQPLDSEPVTERVMESLLSRLEDPAPPAVRPGEQDTGLAPEDAATVVAAVSAELDAEEAAAEQAANDQKNSDATSLPPAIPLPHSASNWAFEETLASHREWIESQGKNGRKADFANAQLDGVELISVNLRQADLHYANLRGTDLLLADLRDACLVRADLEECCLVGTNLEGANLEGATLESSLGLVSRQLAGANLREATLPASLVQFPAREAFRDTADTAVHFFYALMILCAFSWLAIWKTKDIQLVTDSAILPFLHSRKAASAMPTAEIFLIAPVFLFLMYVAFVAKLQRLWSAVLELPAVFPDGHCLGEKEPTILVGLLRAHFRWMKEDPPVARPLETASCLLAAYWLVPVTLIFYWARYLTLQEIHGTILQELLASVAMGIALHATFKVGRPQERWALHRKFWEGVSEGLRSSRPPVFAAVVLAITTFLSFGTIAGVPHDPSRTPQYGAFNIRRWAPNALWLVGYDPYANLTEGSFSTPPAGWNGTGDPVSKVRGIRLDSPRFRYAQAYGAFLANSRLLHADFRGAYLSNADLRSVDLTQSNLQFAIMDSVQMNGANLDRAILDGTHLARADFRDANLSYAYVANSFLMDARFDGASLYSAVLSHGTMVRASFQHTDLRNAHLDESNLEHADFTQAYLWSAGLQASDMKDVQMGTAILIGANLHDANLSGGHFAGAVMNETDLSGTILDGADMRGAFGLGAYQVCSAKSHAGALFDESLWELVDAKCPAGR